MKIVRWSLILVGIVLAALLTTGRGFGEKAVVSAVPAVFSQAPEIRIPVLAIEPDCPDVFAAATSVLYAGTSRGLYCSRDMGKSWRRIFSSGIWGARVRSVAIDPADSHVLYMAAGDVLFCSSDGGRRWRRILGGEGEIFCVTLDPNPPTRVLAGTARGIRASSDRGATWSSLDAGRPAGAVRSIQFDSAAAGRLYALSEAGLFHSDDAGKSWNRLWTAFHSETGKTEIIPDNEAPEEERTVESGDVAIDPASGVLFLGTERGVLVSWDAGNSWAALSSGGFGSPPVFELLLDPGNAGSLYAATGQGLFYFGPTRAGWVPLREGLPAGPIHAVAFGPDRKSLWVGSDVGLFRIPAPPSQKSVLPGSLDHASRVDPKPSIFQVQQAAIRYAEVMPEKIQRWREGAVWRNWIPKFTLSLDQNRDSTVASATSGGKTTFSVGPEDTSVSLGFGFTWDLANFVWNPEQTSIDTRSRLMVQLRQDILEEVTRLFFERERLLAEFQNNPAADPLLKSERVLRIEELTAQLDALTGGWFSENLQIGGVQR